MTLVKKDLLIRETIVGENERIIGIQIDTYMYGMCIQFQVLDINLKRTDQFDKLEG